MGTPWNQRLPELCPAIVRFVYKCLTDTKLSESIYHAESYTEVARILCEDYRPERFWHFALKFDLELFLQTDVYDI